jgi:hypothetical protein
MPTRNQAVLALHHDLGWDPNMLAVLDGLRQVLDGEAAETMDELLRRLQPRRKEWLRAANQPASAPAARPASSRSGNE